MNWQSFLRRHSELFLVLAVLIVISAVFHWIPYKVAFLNFFYIPVLAAGYLLGARRAVLSGVLCVLLVLLYYFYDWTNGALLAGYSWAMLENVFIREWSTLLRVSMWGGFLILIGGAFGAIEERETRAHGRTLELNATLEVQAAELRQTNSALEESSQTLRQQAEDLQQKGLQIEQLKQKLEETLFSAMDSTVARLLIQGRLREEKRNLSVLFCDLEGFTSYAHLRNPEVALEDLNYFYEVMEGLIETYHGHIDKYLGDGIMCEFGAPLDYEQHSLQAVVTGLMMQKHFADKNFPWRLRVGLASGESIVGLLGHRRRSYSCIGEVANLAKRLEELCEGSAVYLDEEANEAVRHLVVTEKVRNQGGRRARDKEVLVEIARLERELESSPEDADLLYATGQHYFRIREASQAVHYFRQAMELRPDSSDFKLAYADATVKQDEYEKISIRGLSEKQGVFKALKLVDPLRSEERFPRPFAERFQHVPALIEVPDEAVLPTEVLDGSVGHSLSVAVLAYALGEELGLAEDVRRQLLLAGRLQDVGKNIIWHHILNHRGVLSEQERKDLERHADESVSIARQMGYDQPAVLEIMANHHEIPNGEGYPRHLKGEEIPLGARITCVADVYCALTEKRPYRRAWDSRVALSEIHKGAAQGRFDPLVVDALNRLMVPV
jgi:HD-GYP domain-containing protein (c-di-GMP phosphodiesterase class II)